VLLDYGGLTPLYSLRPSTVKSGVKPPQSKSLEFRFVASSSRGISEEKIGDAL